MSFARIPVADSAGHPRSEKGQSGRAEQAFLACGIVAGPLFMLAVLAEGATRPGYDPFRFPLSSLAIGDSGWTQIATFVATGSLLLAFAVGLRRALRPGIGAVWVPRLIGLVAIGLIGAGVFVTDPVYGYPTDLPLALAQYSVHGRLHSLFSTPVFVCLPAACFVFARRFAASGKHGWVAYSVFTGLAMLAAFALAGAGFQQQPGLREIAGLLQRLSLLIGFAWIALLAASVRSETRR